MEGDGDRQYDCLALIVTIVSIQTIPVVAWNTVENKKKRSATEMFQWSLLIVACVASGLNPRLETCC